MALNFSELEFPNNVAHFLKSALKQIDPDDIDRGIEGIRIYGRPLMPGDADMTLSVVPANWVPDRNSKEMVGHRREGIFQDYTVIIQGLIVESDEEAGIIKSGKLASRIRDTLYRDPAVDVVLSGISLTYATTHVGQLPSTERVVSWDVIRQNYINNISETGQFMYLSETEFTFRTEISSS